MPLIQSPDLGLNALVPPNALDLREAAKGTQNIVYEYGLLRTPWGFAKLDLTTTGLNSGDTVLSAFQWKEIDETGHLMAVTTEKIYDHNRVSSEWDDKTQDSVTMASAIDTPVSYAVVGHDDTAIYLDDDSSRIKAYYHLIVCDGGLSNIQRWAGKWETDFADLVGGGGYHDDTTHRALQVSLSKRNRLLLISPRIYDSATATWIENNQRIQWPMVGKIETWTGTGSGFANLFDTGGINVWSATLGSDHIIYQTRGIWSLNWVGGTTVFSPIPVIPDLGLLAHHLLYSYNNVHYFIGTDYNVHAYYGGSVKDVIGDKIHRYLQEDLDPQYKNRCWLTMGPQGKFLSIFIVPSGSTYVTKEYRRNMQTEAWMIRDYKDAFSSTTGISSVTLAAAESYVTGETYQTALDTISAYDVSDAGDITRRYADSLLEISRPLTKDYTAGTWTAGGYDYSKIGETFTADISENDIMVVFDGSNATNTRHGTHFYTIFDVSTNGFSTLGTEDKDTNQYHGIADISTNVPADLSVNVKNTIGFFSACDSGIVGDTYNQVLENIQTAEKLILGDSGGFIYEVDETYTADNDKFIDIRHLTPVIDAGMPGNFKRWPGIKVTAKGTRFMVGSRISNFDTSDTGWSDISQELTTEWVNYEFPLNITSKKIQYRLITNLLISDSLLGNWKLDIADDDGRPEGIYPVRSITDFAQLDWLDSGKAEIKILSVPDTDVGYGFPAIPIDDNQKYKIIIRHKSSAASTSGLILIFNQYASGLPTGKTHIGFEGGTNTQTRTNFLILVSGAMPGTSWTVDEYTYTPTAGTKYASFSMYNWNSTTAGVEYHVDYVLMFMIPRTADTFQVSDFEILQPITEDNR